MIKQHFNQIIDSDKRIIYLYGARSSGKSYAVGFLLLLYMLQYPMSVIALTASTYTSVKSGMLSTMRKVAYNEEIFSLFRLNKESIECVNGSRTIIVALEEDSERIKRNVGCNMVWIDDYGNLTNNQYNDISALCREKTKTGRSPQIIITTNGLYNNSFLAEITKNPSEFNADIVKIGLDNDYMDASLKKDLRKLEKTNPQLYKQWYLGEFVDEEVGCAFTPSGYQEAEPSFENYNGLQYAFVDASYGSGKDSDYTAIMICHGDKKGRLVITELILEQRWTITDTLAYLSSKKRLMIMPLCFYSEAGIWNDIAMRNNKMVFPFSVKANDFITQASFWWESKRILMPTGFSQTSYFTEFSKQIYGFIKKTGSSKIHDDAPDVLICGLEKMRQEGVVWI